MKANYIEGTRLLPTGFVDPLTFCLFRNVRGQDRLFLPAILDDLQVCKLTVI